MSILDIFKLKYIFIQQGQIFSSLIKNIILGVVIASAGIYNEFWIRYIDRDKKKAFKTVIEEKM